MEKILEQVFREEIPLTQAIDARVREYTGQSLTLTAPLENNINHKNTAFGGSLYSVCVLSGWGLIFLLLKEQGLTGHIVIQESNTKFLNPVGDDLVATCTFNSEKQVERFITTFKRRGVARIKLTSQIQVKGDPAVIFSGSYVVHS